MKLQRAPRDTDRPESADCKKR